MANLLLRLNFKIFWFCYDVLTWPTRKLTTSIIYLVDYLFSKTKSTIQKLLFLWSIFIVLVLVSLLLYAAFYFVYVPAAEISRPVNLAFSVCPSGAGICSFPTANVTFWNDERKVQEFLASGESYSVNLMLNMPDSVRNKDLGMFMVKIKLFDKDGHISGTSQKSVSMSEATAFQFRSFFMRILDIVLLRPLYLLGLVEQKKTLDIKLFSNYVDDYYHPSVGATVEVQNHIIEVYSATLVLLARFTGLKYYLYNWPLVSTICAFWFNLFMLATGVGVVMYMRREKSNVSVDKRKKTGKSEKHTRISHKPRNLASFGAQTEIRCDNDSDTDDGAVYNDQPEQNHTTVLQPGKHMQKHQKAN